MKVSTIAIGLLVAMLGVIAAAWIIGAPDGAAGGGHPVLPNMSVGGDGQAKHERIFVLGAIFGVLEILFFSTCLALGASRKQRLGDLAVPIIIGALLHAGTFVALVLAYRGYLANDEHPLYLGLPAPTAIMMYGLWWVPMYFIGLYYLKFDEYVFSEADLQRFNEILDKRDRREGIDT